MGLFKNDKFGIKQLLFRHKVNRALKDGIDIYCKSIRLSLRIITDIGMPRNDADLKILKQAVQRYDDAVAELESHVKYARLCIEEDEYA